MTGPIRLARVPMGMPRLLSQNPDWVRQRESQERASPHKTCVQGRSR